MFRPSARRRHPTPRPGFFPASLPHCSCLRKHTISCLQRHQCLFYRLLHLGPQISARRYLNRDVTLHKRVQFVFEPFAMPRNRWPLEPAPQFRELNLLRRTFSDTQGASIPSIVVRINAFQAPSDIFIECGPPSPGSMLLHSLRTGAIRFGRK